MLMGFDTDRALARLAADAARIEDVCGGSDRPWSRPVSEASAHRPPPIRHESRLSRPRRDRVVDAIEIAVIGDPDELGSVLTDDAEGWSPGIAFSSRAEAIAALRERGSPFETVDFRMTRLIWTETGAVAEWLVAVILSTPLLVGGDVLVDGDDRPVEISGASVVDLRGDRIAAIHTYFDDASLIEQVVLGS